MPDRINADRQRRWRDRQAGRLEPVKRLSCSACGAIHTGVNGSLCRKCWRQSPDGKEWQRLRMAAYRAKRGRTATDNEPAPLRCPCRNGRAAVSASEWRPSTAIKTMTVFTLERPATHNLPAARCTFQQRISESGKKWVDVTMLHLTSMGWGGTMGRGDGIYTVRQAKEFYGSLLERGFAPN